MMMLPFFAFLGGQCGNALVFTSGAAFHDGNPERKEYRAVSGSTGGALLGPKMTLTS